MISKVAVIGGGVFGCVIATELSKLGLETHLFEKNSELVSGSTSQSVSRLHLGLHYPRDMRTAKQSIEGFNEFMSEFPEAVDCSFTNYYALSSQNSRVTEDGFRDFAIKSRTPFQEVGKSELAEFGFDTELISALFVSPEGVIDNDVLRALLKTRLSSEAVRVRTALEIGTVERNQHSWRLLDIHGESCGKFDLVILATYALDTIKIRSQKLSARRKYEFQSTLVLGATLDGLAELGVTVIDGDFLTLLPVAFRPRHLIYAPVPSVLTREIAIQPSSLTNSGPKAEQLSVGAEQIIQRLRKYFPDIEAPKDVTLIPGKRAIEANVQTSDRRQTEILELGPRLLSIASGKIDHCFIAAREVRRVLD